jgi:hypothetical protein
MAKKRRKPYDQREINAMADYLRFLIYKWFHAEGSRGRKEFIEPKGSDGAGLNPNRNKNQRI